MLSKVKLRTIDLAVRPAVFTRVRRLAKAAYPKETLVYILGVDAGTNTSIDDIWVPDDVGVYGTKDYVMLQDDWKGRAEKAAKELDLTVLGTIHSHPLRATDSYDASPSEGDICNAAALGPLTGICAVTPTKSGKLRATIRIWGPQIPVEVNFAKST